MVILKSVVTAEDEGILFDSDIENIFSKIPLQADEVTKKIINIIEQGTYNGGEKFVDRFGVTLDIADISTGCKCILCAYYVKDNWVCAIEAGYNAISAAIACLDDAMLIIPSLAGRLEIFGEDKQFEYDNYIYNSISEYNEV